MKIKMHKAEQERNICQKFKFYLKKIPSFGTVFTVLQFCFFLQPIYAIDFEQNVRNVHHYGNWLTMEFRDPYIGRFLLSRASVVDMQSNTTMNISFMLENNICKDVVDFNIKTDFVIQEDINRDGYIEIQVDNKETTVFPVYAVANAGDYFIFFSSEDLKQSNIVGKNILFTNIRGFGLAKFNMKHANTAIHTAKSICNVYLL
jgi:hypothetical protein